MLWATVLACSLVVVYGQDCRCTPDQWEAGVLLEMGSMTNGNGALTEGSMYMSFDAVNKILALQQNITVNGFRVLQRVVQDFNPGGGMFILGSDGNCTRGDLGPWISNCLPANASGPNYFTYGLGDDSVKAKSFIVDYGTYTVYMAVTADTCIPLTEDVVGMYGNMRMFEVLGFANVKAGIANRQVFDVPAHCVNAPMNPAINRRAPATF